MIKTMKPLLSLALCLAALCCIVFQPSEAFVGQPTSFAVRTNTVQTTSLSSSFFQMQDQQLSLPSETVAAATIDPSNFLSDVLGGIIGSPLILLIPVGAALTVAFLIGFLIFSYANPEVEDDE